MSVAESIHEQIVREVTAWPGVTSSEHRFGGVEFRVGRRELGHLHGNRLADLPFPVRVREQLVAEGKAKETDFPMKTDGFRASKDSFIDGIAFGLITGVVFALL